jgi:hypothetical protein
VAKKDQHLFERVSDRVATWLDDMPERLATRFMMGGRPPFTAQISEQEKLELFEHDFFNPDDTPNEQKRAMWYEIVGPDGYKQILFALNRKRKGQTASLPEGFYEVDEGTDAETPY